MLGYNIDDPEGIFLSAEILNASAPQGQGSQSSTKAGQQQRRARLARKSRY
tara:strand:+ start:15195 stop:15347 length:153 start_codon:yes stop_codon:yes gene_type:complete